MLVPTCQPRAGWQLRMRLWQEEETKGPALLEPGEVEDMSSPSIPTNPEPHAPKTIPAIPAAAPQPPSPTSPPWEAQTGRWTPQPCWDMGESPENIRTQASSGGFPQWPQPQPCSPRGVAAPKNPRPDCSGAADQPAHQGKIPVFLFYSLCLLPRREPTGTNTL